MFRTFLTGLVLVCAAMAWLAKPAPVAVSQAVPAPFTGRCIGGVNVAGAEFGKQGGQHGTDYIYPAPEASGYAPAEWWASRGMATFRLPVRWERLQPEAFGPLDANELSRLLSAAEYYTQYGSLIIDLHNFGRYKDDAVADAGDGRLEDVWAKIVRELPASDRVVLGIMNEPYGVAADTWAAKAQSVIDEVRRHGAQHTILVPGTRWTGAHSWQDGHPSNADALLAITDSANRLVFEAHQYLDLDSSGTDVVCVSPAEAVRRLKPFTRWLKENNRWGLIGEFAASPSASCQSSLEAMLKHMHSEDVYVGWTYWATGPWWSDRYPFYVDHASAAGDAQEALLARYACR